MKYQSLASKIMSDWKSQAHGEAQEYVLKAVISENWNKIIEESGEI